MLPVRSPNVMSYITLHHTKLLIILMFTGGARSTRVAVAVRVMVAVTVKKRVERSMVAVIVAPVMPVRQTTVVAAIAIVVVVVAAAILIQKLPLTQVDLDQ